MKLRLQALRGRYAVARLNPATALPSWPSGEVVSITHTPDELSIVCDEDAVPDDVRAERSWRGFVVEGPIPFTMTGVAASLTSSLAAAKISVFLISTFDTDYLFVKDATFARACDALRAAGHQIGESSAR